MVTYQCNLIERVIKNPLKLPMELTWLCVALLLCPWWVAQELHGRGGYEVWRITAFSSVPLLNCSPKSQAEGI